MAMLTTKDVCEQLSISRSSVGRLVALGDLPCYQLGKSCATTRRTLTPIWSAAVSRGRRPSPARRCSSQRRKSASAAAQSKTLSRSITPA